MNIINGVAILAFLMRNSFLCCFLGGRGHFLKTFGIKSKNLSCQTKSVFFGTFWDPLALNTIFGSFGIFLALLHR